MTYKNALNYIHSAPRTVGAPTLVRMRALCAYLGDPQNKLRFIHVAGTNGKGSFCAMLQNVISAAGYRCGLYISPYITDFRERMSIGREMVSMSELTSIVEEVEAAVRKIKNDIKRAADPDKTFLPPKELPREMLTGSVSSDPVQFEIITAAAFIYFCRHSCDIVVLECGLGGAFDATNVISPPLCAVLMNIGLDHMELLGDTVEKIAKEKCGIIKRGTLEVVSYPQPYPEAYTVITDACANAGCRLGTVAKNLLHIDRISLGGLDFTYRSDCFHTRLCAEYQAFNAATVLETVAALRRLGMSISGNAVSSGLATTQFPARFEVVGIAPAVIVDGAHNAPAVSALVSSLERMFGESEGKLYVIVGMLSDKHPADALEPFFEYARRLGDRLGGIYTLTPENTRAMNADMLAEIIRSGVPGASVTAFSNIAEAVKKAVGQLTDADTLICFGSLYLASSLRVEVRRGLMRI